ncbi:MAG TPA: hypothetical protein VEJ89_01815 [Myxococcaceae bacterium]|jgi:hypothetical protein|nr:hypothetical protein [Myxococcaceae bacterium]
MNLRALLRTAVLLGCTSATAQVQSTLSDPSVLAAGTTASRSVQQPSTLSTPLRVGLEAGAGVLGGAAVGAFNAWVMQSVLGTQNNSSSTQRLVSLFGAPLGVAVGAPLAVSLTGYTLGERGSFLVSWLSAMAGLAIGGSAYLVSTGISNSQAAQGTYVLALALPVAGAVIGYELSAQAARAAPQGTIVVPTVAVLPQGASAGVAGRF